MIHERIHIRVLYNSFIRILKGKKRQKLLTGTGKEREREIERRGEEAKMKTGFSRVSNEKKTGEKGEYDLQCKVLPEDTDTQEHELSPCSSSSLFCHS